MKKTFKVSEVEIDLKKDKYVVLYDPNDPRNSGEEPEKMRLTCIISTANEIDKTDLQNAAIFKEAYNILNTLLEVRNSLSGVKRGGFDKVRARDTIKIINSTLEKIYK